MEHSWILLVSMIGHILCVYADRLLLCTPGGQFSFPDMKDNARMAKHIRRYPRPGIHSSYNAGNRRRQM